MATAAVLREQLDLADQLLNERKSMIEPQDLPGRYGRAVRAMDRVLQATGIESVLGDGWAVWRHGYAARVTQDLEIALPADRIDEFERVAGVSGFDLLASQPGRWPKLTHRETGIQIDILPEGGRPGRQSKLAPTTIPHPRTMGAEPGRQRYMSFPALTVLKLAAGRERDESDVVELIRSNLAAIDELRRFVATVHPDYVVAFDRLAQSAQEQSD